MQSVIRMCLDSSISVISVTVIWEMDWVNQNQMKKLLLSVGDPIEIENELELICAKTSAGQLKKYNTENIKQKNDHKLQ